MPISGLSSAVISTLKGSLAVPTPTPVQEPPIQVPLPSIRGQRAPSHSSPPPTIDLNNPTVITQLREQIPTFFFAESVSGVSHDAQLGLRKPRSVPWSASEGSPSEGSPSEGSPGKAWDDIDDAARLLCRVLAEDERVAGYAEIWQVDAWHAETDGMVGERGRVWFDACWGEGSGVRRESGRRLEYNSRVVRGADHNFILDPVFGACEMWLGRVGEGREELSTS